ncbi:MAG: aconitate hydratase AcnA [Gammaproteobacteria bacterium]
MKTQMKHETTCQFNGQTYRLYSLPDRLTPAELARLPFTLKILLENLLRSEDGQSVKAEDIEAIIQWDPKKIQEHEIAFQPSRVILQDFTGVPAVVDLAAMRQAMQALGGDPNAINPLSPVELVIDHSVMVDDFGTPKSFATNTKIEYERNMERYAFLRWGQLAFKNFKVVPPGTGIVHQVNLEYLARVVFVDKSTEPPLLYPDTLVGTDSHTTMINGLGVLGWGVGGIEAEAAMLGQPVTMLIPDVIGFKLSGQLKEGATATDLVLTVVEMLRKKGVVGKFVEFYGEGLQHLPIADRATIANMSPEFGATCGIFPIDKETLNFLTFSGRSKSHVDLIEQYAKYQGLFWDANTPDPQYTDTLELDLSTVEPCIAGPKRPQDRIKLKEAKSSFNTHLQTALKEKPSSAVTPVNIKLNDEVTQLDHGHVVIAAITSCTNTSNPAVMLAAGLVAKAAVEKGLKTKPWVKTSLAPGSQVVTDYLEKAGLTAYLDKLGFNLVGYGCTTCIGNSGPLPQPVQEAVKEHSLLVSAVLSGNRNFEGRIHPQVRHAFLASPPLVVIYALTGTMNIDLYQEPLGVNDKGEKIYLKDIWPSTKTILETARNAINPDMFTKRYAHVFDGDELWKGIKTKPSEIYNWEKDSTYVKHPPYFENISIEPKPIQDIKDARVLLKLGDSVTTDHISPAGSIHPESPAGRYLQEKGVELKDFNSYGSRRGNHEIMIRGTFANTRIKNLLLTGVEGGLTRHLPSNTQMSVFDASRLYQQERVPLVVLAGQEYGTGSSRDWAAKGTNLLGIKAVIAESFERIHRSNLIGMGVLPLEYLPGQNADHLKLSGEEAFSISLKNLSPRATLKVEITDQAGKHRAFEVRVRIDTPKELEYFKHGGILNYVLRQIRNTQR